ncbi:pca operon transcription factor PcaQ [Yoonia sp.]|uniref:pca operon transcription factor PcaQ n=1 Tax=Yoonia sp. TaxID=2212373 RepID=UPI0019F6F149|nr:pca operon transcription factor PcaQ [Yoonia sp.]MBE0413725.1 pca operon transcription factor PcaQ [Yoonia sp.]
MDRRIKFRHLEAFSAIARAGSFKIAAAQLHLTQPAISKTLKELEEILGVTVLERSRSGVALTAQGEVFLGFAEQSTAALRHGLHSIRATYGAAGRLKIGALPSVASGLVPRAALDFAARNPDTLLEVHEGPYHDLTQRLRGGGLDLVVGRLGRPETMAGLEFRQLYTEQVVVVARPDSPAAALRDIVALDAYRVLYPPKDSAIRPLLARHLITQGVPLFRNRIESASPNFARTILLADPDTVWMISHGVVAGDLANGRLVALDFDMRATLGAVGIISRAEEVASVAAKSFCRALANAGPQDSTA